MVRLSKQARRRNVSTKRPKIKTTAAKKCCGCSCPTKAAGAHIKMHENGISGDIASRIFVAKAN